MSAEPIWIRRAQLTDAEHNNNKFYVMEWWGTHAVAKYGRVGDAGQSTTYHISESGAQAKFEKKIHRSKDNGTIYVEVELAKKAATPAAPTITTPTVYDPLVAKLVSLIFGQAQAYIQTYLASTVDALSQDQIDKAQNVLNAISNASDIHDPTLPNLIQHYYNLIPTKLSRKLEINDLIMDFKVREQQDRLQQLASAISTQAATTAGVSQIDALGGTIIRGVPESVEVYATVAKYIADTFNRKVRFDLYTIKLPLERAAFEANTVGKQNIRSLWHGTRNRNVRHILNKTGLIIPQSHANGSLFGSGIYFSDGFAKSYNYTDQGNSAMLFLANVAMGNPKVFRGSDRYSGRNAPAGYDSSFAIHVDTRYNDQASGNEIVVYRQPQQTIWALVVLK